MKEGQVIGYVGRQISEEELKEMGKQEKKEEQKERRFTRSHCPILNLIDSTIMLHEWDSHFTGQDEKERARVKKLLDTDTIDVINWCERYKKVV